jgi:hypothetical protein
MVVCLSDGPASRCDPPLCTGCGTQLVPEHRYPVATTGEQSMWRHACDCVIARPEYEATEEEVAAVRALLDRRGAPSWDRLARQVLTGLADCKTRFVIRRPDGVEIEIQYDEVRHLLGHAFEV